MKGVTPAQGLALNRFMSGMLTKMQFVFKHWGWYRPTLVKFSYYRFLEVRVARRKLWIDHVDTEVQILDDFGEVLKRYSVPQGKTQFEGVSWEGVDLFGAQLGGANFKDAILYWASFASAHLNGANFQHANLQGAVLIDASCVGANFRGANLGRDNLGGNSQLQGADLTATILDGVQLEGAEYDERTLFPKGFDPKLPGMIERKV